MNPQEACIQQQDLKNNIGYVYCLTFPNGKKYVGQSIRQWKKRWSLHKYKKSCCKALSSALSKYKVQEIEFELITYAKDKEQLNELQSKYIKEFNSLAPFGYNLKDKEQRIIYSMQTRKKISDGNRRNRKNKLSENKSFYYYDEGMNIASITCNLMKFKEVISYSKLSAMIKDRQRWKTEQFRQKYKNSHTKAVRQKSGKPVYFVQKDKVFICASQIIQKYPELKFSKSQINKCCRGIIKDTKGYHFRYI